jgi:hypothetical protein
MSYIDTPFLSVISILAPYSLSNLIISKFDFFTASCNAVVPNVFY